MSRMTDLTIRDWRVRRWTRCAVHVVVCGSNLVTKNIQWVPAMALSTSSCQVCSVIGPIARDRLTIQGVMVIHGVRK